MRILSSWRRCYVSVCQALDAQCTRSSEVDFVREWTRPLANAVTRCRCLDPLQSPALHWHMRLLNDQPVLPATKKGVISEGTDSSMAEVMKWLYTDGRSSVLGGAAGQEAPAQDNMSLGSLQARPEAGPEARYTSKRDPCSGPDPSRYMK